ncbi:transporter [Clostridia bacterium]|nr:transporter [Clostridia bacterium]
MKNPKEAKSSFLLLLTAFIWGLAFVAQRQGADYVGTFTYNGVRFILGGLSLIPVVFALEKRDRSTAEKAAEDKRKIKLTYAASLVMGLILFSASNLQQFGIEITGSAGKAGFITGLYTVIVPIAGFFLGRKVGVLTWVGAVLAVSGLYLLSVTNGLGSVGIGDVLLIIGALFWTAHIMVIDRFAPKTYAIRISMLQFFVVGFLSLPLAFVFEDITVSGLSGAAMPIVYGGVFSAGVAYTLQVVGQRHVAPSKAAIIFSLEAFFAALGGAIILGERMSARGYLGCALIFTAIILSQLPRGEKISRRS